MASSIVRVPQQGYDTDYMKTACSGQIEFHGLFKPALDILLTPPPPPPRPAWGTN